MIRQSIRRRLTLPFLLAVLVLLGSYAFLRSASGTSSAAPKTAAETGSAPAPGSAGTPQLPAPDRSTPRHPISKSRDRKSAQIPKEPAARLLPARASLSSTNSYSIAATPKSSHAAPKTVSFASEPADPISLNKALSGKLRAAPVPQGSGTTPPNPPTINLPADGSTGGSTSPTLSVDVSDPNSNNVTVNFYGKVVPSVAPGPSFSIIELPDTQYYSAGLENGTLAMFTSQTQWIVNNIAADNIVFVAGLGDVVQDGNNNGNYSEWVNANSAVSLLDNPATTGLPQGIPYSFGVGNHDQGPSGDGSPDDTAAFNQYFGASRYVNKPDYAGHYGTDNDNHYELFSASGMDFILINIAYMDPAYNATELNSVLAWANGLLQTYSNRRGIVVSHYLINSGFNATWSGQGQSTYSALSGNPNLFLMLCGHYNPPEGQRADVSNGNRIYTFLSDYQETGFGGDGWLRILTFVPASNQIQVQSYSPFINQYETTTAGNFTVNYDMHGNGNGFTLLASNTGVLSGSASSTTWPSLVPGSMYEWYVTVSNSTGTTVGPLWSFTTAGDPPVTVSPTSLTFPSQPVNTVSTSQSVTVTNTGSAALGITSIAASAQYAQTNNCPSSLAANGVCTISVTFTPTAAGTQSGNITITDSAVGSPQQIALTGNATAVLAPAVSLSAGSVTFANAAVSVVQDSSTTGSGSTTLALKFASNVTKNNLMVVGVSSYAGNAFASPAITDTLGSTWSLAVADNPGTTGTPALASIYYAIVPSTGANTVTVHMTGTNNLHLHIYELSGLVTSSPLDQIGSNFQSGATAATVSTSGPTTSANEFAFAYFGRDNGSGTWTAGTGYGNTLASPNTGAGTDAFSEGATISSTGTQTATATASATDALTSVIATFVAANGGTPVGATSAAQTLTLNNTGSASLSISSIAASGDFGQTNTCGTFVAVGGNCTISVTFTPTATGARTGAITITDNASNSPQSVGLSGTGTPASGPVASLSPTSLPFGSQTLNTPSASQTVTLSNPGSMALSITSIAASAQYSQTNTCGASVAASGNCTISVTFTPTATGTQTGTITITDNAPGSPHVVNLTGTGTAATAPAVSLSPTSLPFGSQTLNTPSAAQTVTLTNSGTATLNITSIAASAQYAETNTCGASVTASGNCTISVTFTPTATGTQNGTITITDNAPGSPHTVSLTGTGTAATAPAVSLSPTSLPFGSQTLNTPSAAQTITLTNSGTATLNITSIAASAQYSQTNTCGASVTASGNCTISVTFTPTATGTQTGTITITDNATGSPHIVTLTGTGTSAGATTVTLSVTSLAFADQQIATTSASKTVRLTNSGTVALSITSIAPSGDFSETNNCGASISAGGHCTITVKYVPTVAGAETGAITITDNATGSPQSVPLTGTGTDITLSPTSLTFGTVAVKTTSAAQTITLTNAGTVALTITKVAVSSQYAQTNTCGTSVAGGANCTISVTFKPTTTGSHTGTVTITDNATGAPKTVSLTGTGQ